MTDTPAYTPPEVWVWEKDDSPKWRYGNINRPIAGATHEKELARGKHPLQLYSLATPNGVKVTIMLEELLAAGHSGAEYDAWLIRIGEGNQFGSGFVGVNPNSKIPALMDYSEQTPLRVFESGATRSSEKVEARLSPPDSNMISSTPGNLRSSSSPAAMLSVGSSRITVCGQAPASTAGAWW